MCLLNSLGFLFNFMKLFKFSCVTRYVCVYWLHWDFCLTSRGCSSSPVLQGTYVFINFTGISV